MKSCVIYLTKKTNKISAASQTDVTAQVALKICQGQPPTICSQCSRFHINLWTFGGVIAERVNPVFCPVEYLHDRLFEPIIIGRLICIVEWRHQTYLFRSFRSSYMTLSSTSSSASAAQQAIHAPSFFTHVTYTTVSSTRACQLWSCLFTKFGNLMCVVKQSWRVVQQFPIYIYTLACRRNRCYKRQDNPLSHEC